jgi:fatty acid amide hydrolase 2
VTELPQEDVLTATAFELAARIRDGRESARSVVGAHIARIEVVNPLINAVVADRFAAALAEAEAVDRALQAGGAAAAALGPLAGVPCSIKEMIDLEGMPSTFGARSRSGRTALGDATVVQRLRTAGAIPLCVTNVPEWGFWFETDNVIYGRTRNPHDLRRTSGGSSGGEAALVAAGGAPFGIGSDIGGSIRIPSAFCGVAGHKPSPGLVPLTGHYPVYATGPDAALGKRSPFLAVGPIARSARDLMPLLRILAGPDGIDPNARSRELGDPESVDWRGRKVVVLDDPRIRLAGRADAEVRGATRAAAGYLRAAGADIVQAEPGLFRDAVDLWAVALRAASQRSLAETAGLARWPDLSGSLARAMTRSPAVSTPLFMFILGEALGAVRFRDVRPMLDRLADRVAQFDRLVGGDGILLLPPHPRVAPLHGAALRRPFDFAYTAIFNALRAPATVVPLYRNAAGLPLAVQIAAQPGNDHLTIAAAVRIEAASAWFSPVPRLPVAAPR